MAPNAADQTRTFDVVYFLLAKDLEVESKYKLPYVFPVFKCLYCSPFFFFFCIFNFIYFFIITVYYVYLYWRQMVHSS